MMMNFSTDLRYTYHARKYAQIDINFGLTDIILLNLYVYIHIYLDVFILFVWFYESTLLFWCSGTVSSHGDSAVGLQRLVQIFNNAFIVHATTPLPMEEKN